MANALEELIVSILSLLSRREEQKFANAAKGAYLVSILSLLSRREEHKG